MSTYRSNAVLVSIRAERDLGQFWTTCIPCQHSKALRFQRLLSVHVFLNSIGDDFDQFVDSARFEFEISISWLLIGC